MTEASELIGFALDANPLGRLPLIAFFASRVLMPRSFKVGKQSHNSLNP
jgi:hypothetical protein